MNCLNLGKNLERGINHRKDLHYFSMYPFFSKQITISLGIFIAYICIAKIAGDVKYVVLSTTYQY